MRNISACSESFIIITLSWLRSDLLCLFYIHFIVHVSYWSEQSDRAKASFVFYVYGVYQYKTLNHFMHRFVQMLEHILLFG